MDGKQIDIDRDSQLAGNTIRIFNYLDDTWKSAVVQEIDLAEREILVDYEDGTQEWIGVDGRKICFPPADKPEETIQAPITCTRRSSTKIEKLKPAVKKAKDVLMKSASVKKPTKSIAVKKLDSRSQVKMKSLKTRPKSKKAMSKTSEFLRLKFKTNEKPIKGNAKPETKKRKRISAEEVYEHDMEMVMNTTEENGGDLVDDMGNGEASPKNVFKSTQRQTKRPRREIAKLKLKIGRNKATIIHPESEVFSPDTSKRKGSQKRESSMSESIAQSSEKTEPLLFTTAQEKKIKTLLPKRSLGEPFTKLTTTASAVRSPETSAPVSSPGSLASIYPVANVTPTLGLSPAASKGYACPKQDCKKPPFRTENLLMMHIKHYHKEYRDLLSSMPNVADLAYARTVGEHIESPKAGCLEKIVQIEEGRLKAESDDLLEIPDGEAALKKIGVNGKLSELENADRTLEQSPRPAAAKGKRIQMSKRLSGSEPSSPKVSVLLAQLQEPPLIAPSISIQSESADAELSVSQTKLASVLSPQFSDNSNSQFDLDEKPQCSKNAPTKKRRLSQLESTDVINCSCGYGLEDGLMVQCVLCQCWQHGACVNFEKEVDVPPNYTCNTCKFPKRCHTSRKYMYVQNWLREGVIPSYRFNKPREDVSQKRGEFLKQSHEFLCDLTELRHAIRSLQVKIHILRQTPDHPKLYLWAKSWNDETKDEKEDQPASDGGPVPEDAINMDDCRKHLSEHIDQEIRKCDSMLRDIEKRVEKLEQMDAGDTNGDDADDDFNKEPEKYTSVAKQTLLMLLRDLTALQNLKYCER